MFKFRKIFMYFLLCNSVISHAQTCTTGSIPATTPSSQFTDNRDGTATDSNTGLTWKKCLEGQNSNDCTGTQTYTWQEALQRALVLNSNGGFAGKSDWRLPNIKELRSIIEKQCSVPAINLTLFPGNSSPHIWTSSPIAGANGSRAWYVDFYYGSTLSDLKSSKLYVRLVRGGR
jgi:hypothetical protein